MDIQRWIAAEHAAVRTRFDSSIREHVPARLWSAEPPGGGPSITHLVFHATFHQDLALNTAIRDHPPLLTQFRDGLGLAAAAPWAGLGEAEDRAVTASIDLDALDVYAETTHEATARWISRLSALALDSIPDTSRRLDDHAGIPHDGDMGWLHAMWQGKTVAWFLQWECIGHGISHVGEMTNVRNRFGLSPF
jgi:hypothetical protein